MELRIVCTQNLISSIHFRKHVEVILNRLNANMLFVLYKKLKLLSLYYV